MHEPITYLNQRTVYNMLNTAGLQYYTEFVFGFKYEPDNPIPCSLHIAAINPAGDKLKRIIPLRSDGSVPVRVIKELKAGLVQEEQAIMHRQEKNRAIFAEWFNRRTSTTTTSAGIAGKRPTHVIIDDKF